jgi:urease accessory protein
MQILGGASALDAPWGWGGNDCMGTMLACPARREWLDALRSIDQPGVLIGLTLVDGVLVARCMGRRSEAVRNALVRLWQMLRPLLLLRDPVSPRIWST